MSVSFDPETSRVPFESKESAVTAPRCPFRVTVEVDVLIFQILIFPSSYLQTLVSISAQDTIELFQF
jgi:hypothetical protein